MGSDDPTEVHGWPWLRLAWESSQARQGVAERRKYTASTNQGPETPLWARTAVSASPKLIEPVLSTSCRQHAQKQQSAAPTRQFDSTCRSTSRCFGRVCWASSPPAPGTAIHPTVRSGAHPGPSCSRWVPICRPSAATAATAATDCTALQPTTAHCCHWYQAILDRGCSSTAFVRRNSSHAGWLASRNTRRTMLSAPRGWLTGSVLEGGMVQLRRIPTGQPFACAPHMSQVLGAGTGSHPGSTDT